MNDKRIRWSTADISVLIKYFENKGSKYCLELLETKRDLNLIAKKARELGLIRNHK